MEKILVSADALREVLSALNGPGHLIRELQVTRNPIISPDNPIEQLLRDYNEAGKSPDLYYRIGKAVMRACGELPEGYELHIELERGAGGVRLHLPESDVDLSDFDAQGGDFACVINEAIDHAVKGGA